MYYLKVHPQNPPVPLGSNLGPPPVAYTRLIQVFGGPQPQPAGGGAAARTPRGHPRTPPPSGVRRLRAPRRPRKRARPKQKVLRSGPSPNKGLVRLSVRPPPPFSAVPRGLVNKTTATYGALSGGVVNKTRPSRGHVAGGLSRDGRARGAGRRVQGGPQTPRRDTRGASPFSFSPSSPVQTLPPVVCVALSY